MSFLKSHILSRFALTTLTAGSLSVLGLMSIPVVNPCNASVWGNSSQTTPRTAVFGRSARAGRDGLNGRDGASNSDQGILVDGTSRTPLRLDLAGRDGEAGTDGEDADPPRCQRQPRNVRHNLRAAHGANGGAGGSGGNGGNGGDLTIHYRNAADLKQVLVDASGGRGSRGGRGGLGRNACDCTRPSWTVEICSDGNCYNETYTCTDGGDGYNGPDGSDGTSGETGQLILVNLEDLSTPLPIESPDRTVSIARLAKEPVYLSRHIWETRSGAQSLLASGSIVQDNYYDYQGTIERQFSLDWQANLEGDRFNDDVTLSLAENGEVDIDFPDNYWLLGETFLSGTQMTYRIDGILPIDEVTQLAFGSVEGRSRTFAVEVIDRAQLFDEVETRFELTYSTSNDEGRRYTVQYEGAIDGEFVERDRNRFKLALGRLPIRSQLMSGGTEARVELSVIRSYGNNETTQDLRWSGRL